MKISSFYKLLFLLPLFLSSALFAGTVSATPQLKVTTHGGILQFNNRNAHTEVKDINVSFSSQTLEFWLQTDERNSSATFFSLNGATELLQINSSNEGNLSITTTESDGTSHLYTSNKVISDGLWHHIAYTLESNSSDTTLKLYIDGETALTSDDTNYTLSESNLALSLGKYSATALASIDELRIWNIAKTQADNNSTKNAQVAPNANLQLYYSFNEYIANSVIDLSANKHNLLINSNFSRINFLNNTPYLDSTAHYSVNDENKLTSFNQDENFTISFWVKVAAKQHDTFATYNYILDKGVDNPTPYAFRVFNQTASAESEGKLQVVRSDSNNTSRQKINDNLWHYVVYTKKADKFRLYVDGISSAVSTASTADTANDNNITIGGSANSFTGSIREVAIYKKALSFSDRKQLQASVFYIPELIAYWPLDDDQNSTAYEKINGLNAQSNANVTTVIDRPILFGNTLYINDVIPMHSQALLLNSNGSVSYDVNGTIPEELDFNTTSGSIFLKPTTADNLTFDINATEDNSTYNSSINVINVHTTPKLDLNLSNINLNEHNITTLKLYDYDDNLSVLSFDIRDELNSSNVTLQNKFIFAYGHNYAIAFDLNNSGNIESYFYDFNGGKLDSEAFHSLQDIFFNEFYYRRYTTPIDAGHSQYDIDLSNANFYSLLTTHFNFNAPNGLLDSYQLTAATDNGTSPVYLPSIEVNQTLITYFTPFSHENKSINFTLEKYDPYYSELSVFKFTTEPHDIKIFDLNISFAQMNVTLDNNVTYNLSTVGYYEGSSDFSIYAVDTITNYALPIVKGKDYSFLVSYNDGNSSLFDANTGTWVDESEIDNVTPYSVTTDSFSLPAPPSEAPFKPTLSITDPELHYLPLFELNRTNSGSMMDAYKIVLNADKTRAYVANGTAGLTVLDLTNTKVQIANEYTWGDNNATNVALSHDGTKLYAVDSSSSSIQQFSINQNGTLNSEANLSVTMPIVDMKVSKDDNYLHLAHGENNLTIMDLRDNSTVEIPIAAYATTESNNSTLFVASGNIGLFSIDISDPHNPNPIDVNTDIQANSIYLEDIHNTLFVGAENIVYFCDTNDINTYDSIPVEGNITSITLDPFEKKAYLLNGTQLLQTIDPNEIVKSYIAQEPITSLVALNNKTLLITQNGEGNSSINQILAKESMFLDKSSDSVDFNLSINDLNEDNLTITIDTNDTSLIQVTPQFNSELNVSDYLNKSLLLTIDNLHNENGGIAEVNITLQDTIHTVVKSFLIAVEQIPHYIIEGTLINNDSNVTDVFIEDADGNLFKTPIVNNQFQFDINKSATYSTGIFVNSSQKYYYDGNKSFTKAKTNFNPYINGNFNVGQLDVSIAHIEGLNSMPTIFTPLNDINLNEDFKDFNLTLNVDDIDGDELNITIESNNTAILDINASFTNQLLTQGAYRDVNLTYSLVSVPNAFGSVRVTLKVDDGNLTTNKSFNVNVTEQTQYYMIEGTLINNDSNVTDIFLEDADGNLFKTPVVDSQFQLDINKSATYSAGIFVNGSEKYYYDGNKSFTKAKTNFHPYVNGNFNVGQLDVSAYHIEGANISDYLHVNAEDLTIYDGEEKNLTLSITHDYGKDINVTIEQNRYSLFSVDAPNGFISQADYNKGIALTFKAHEDQIGSDTIRVIVRDSEGAYKIVPIDVNVKKSFTLDVNQSVGIAPLTISMRANVSGTDFQTSYSLPVCYFDGKASGLNIFTFQDAGEHTISCTVENSADSITKTRKVYAYASDAIKIDLKKGWNAVALPYKMELEESDISKYFGDDRINAIYKYTPLGWSYWNKKSGIDNTQTVAKFSSLSSKNGLWIQADEDLTLYFQKNGSLTNTPDESAEYLFNGWYFTSFNEDKEITSIVKLVEAKGKNVEYIWINEDGKDKVYDPTNQYSGFENITKIEGKVSRTTPLWIKVK